MNRTKLACPKGTKDLHEAELYKIDQITNKIFQILRCNGYHRIDTPTFEHTELFKSIGYFSPEKCYVFLDKSGRELILRPDINAPISRALLNHPSLYTLPEKLFFCDKVFRYRHGKKREFRMCGIELYGIADFHAEIDIFLSLEKIIKAAGFSDYRIEFNNLRLVQELLSLIFKKNGLDLKDVDSCIYSLRHGNPLNVLSELAVSSNDKELICSLLTDDIDSFALLDHIVSLFPELENVRTEIESFYHLMSKYGIKSIFKISQLHGTGFYSGLTYKIFVDDIKDELGDGGRYDDMTLSLGGPRIPATGLGFGIERLVRFMSLKENSQLFSGNKKILFYADDDTTKLKIYTYFIENNIQDVVVEIDLGSKKLSTSLKYAQKKSYDYLVVVDKNQYKIISLFDDLHFIKDYTNFNILDVLSCLNLGGKDNRAPGFPPK